MNPKKLLVIAEKYGLFALVGLTAVAFLLSCLESYQGIDHDGLVRSIWVAVSETITSDPHDSEGWTRTMHVLLTAVLGWAATRVYMSSAGFKWDTFSARYIVRDHIVIVAGRDSGSNPEGASKADKRGADLNVDKSALAVDLALSLSADHRVVLCLPSLDPSSTTRLWEAGATVLKDDMDTPEVLEAAGLARARMLFAMRDSYAENIVLSRAAMSPGFENPALRCNCMIEPVAMKREFRLEDYLEPESLSRVRVFNEAEMIARAILRDHPPDQAVATTGQRVHLLLVGLGSVGQSILLQLARMGHYRRGIKPKVTIVDRQVGHRYRQLQETHPALDQWLDIETEESRIEGIGQAEIERWASDPFPITMVYVCVKDEIANLRIARLLLRSLTERESNGGPVTPIRRGDVS